MLQHHFSDSHEKFPKIRFFWKLVEGKNPIAQAAGFKYIREVSG